MAKAMEGTWDLGAGAAALTGSLIRAGGPGVTVVSQAARRSHRSGRLRGPQRRVDQRPDLPSGHRPPFEKADGEQFDLCPRQRAAQEADRAALKPVEVGPELVIVGCRVGEQVHGCAPGSSWHRFQRRRPAPRRTNRGRPRRSPNDRSMSGVARTSTATPPTPSLPLSPAADSRPTSANCLRRRPPSPNAVPCALHVPWCKPAVP